MFIHDAILESVTCGDTDNVTSGQSENFINKSISNSSMYPSLERRYNFNLRQ